MSNHSLNHPIELVQALPGCIQLRATHPTGHLWLDKLGQQMLQQKGVCVVQPDPVTGNLTIIFDPRLVTLPTMLTLLQPWGISGSVIPAMSASMQVGTFLYDNPNVDSLLPMIVGMIAMETFQLRGGWKMLVNLAATVLTRQLLDQVEQTAMLPPNAATGDVFSSTADPAASSEVDITASPLTTSPLTTSPPADPPADPPSVASAPVQVVHSTAGRIRLRVPQVKQAEIAQRVQDLLAAQPFVTTVRVNHDAASVVLTHTADCSDQALQEQLAGLIASVTAQMPPSPPDQVIPVPESGLDDSEPSPNLVQTDGATPLVDHLGIDRSNESTAPEAENIFGFRPAMARELLREMFDAPK